jgi:hypothetical protein
MRPMENRFEAAVLPVGCVMQRRLVAACVVVALSLVPLTANAAGAVDVDALWNQPQGVSVDNAFYTVQEWWDGLTRSTQSDPTQRGMAELAQANADLLNAYTLLQRQRSGAGPQPVAIIDPFLSGVYNFVTGSNSKAPIGSLMSWANESLLKLEGRGSTNDIVQTLLRDYRTQQSAAERDLHLAARSDAVALWAANADRESAFLLKIKGVAIPAEGLSALLNDAGQSTIALAAKHRAEAAKAHAKAKGKAATGKSQGATPSGEDGQSQEKD